MSKRNEADIQAEKFLNIQEELSKKSKHDGLFLTVTFLFLIFGLLLLFFILPKERYSKTDNQMLASPPSFSMEKLANGSFTKDSVNYLKDHFPFRTKFIALSSVYDLCMGKQSSGNILLGKDGYLIAQEGKKEPNNLFHTIRYLQSKKDVQVALAGNKADVLNDKLPFFYPKNPPIENREAVLQKLDSLGISSLNLTSVLQSKKDENLYYKTDHHWTSLGAYYAAKAILERDGKVLLPLDRFERETATENFKGTSYNSSGFYFMKGEKLEFFRYDGDEEFQVTYLNALGKPMKQQQGFYRREALKDSHHGTAYDAFVQGVNHPMVKIESTKEKDRPTLLVLKDSFAHSVLPFLALHYDIVTLDIRSADSTMIDRVFHDFAIDKVLILCSTDTLTK